MTIGQQLARFIDWWKGKRCSGYSDRGGQCVDLFRHWLKATVGDPYKTGIPSVRAAKQIYGVASARKWRKTRWKADLFPPAGAIVVFDGHDRNEWGHVAIARAGSTRHVLKTFDCNWSLPGRCSSEEHRYDRDRVIGWLTPR